jgi:glycerol-3-phosphate O-acyltransferase / dihydroxyacetone phosphate acyltransferase
MLLYLCLKAIAKIALRLFFRRFDVRHRERLLKNGPIIVVANHPNTFMDPIIPATLLVQRSAFVGNGSIFSRYTRPILEYLHVIPVYRKKDKVAAMSQAELNKFTFQRCYDYLANGGTLMIFPEGTSELERRMREIKTGTARIALGAEFEHNFELGVKIIPVGINYSDPTRFRSDVFINVGEAIDVSYFKEQFQPESFEAVEALTDLIEKRLAELVIITEDEDEDSVVRSVEKLYKNQLLEEINPATAQQAAADFDLVQQIVAAVRYFEKTQPEGFRKLQVKMKNYLDNLQLLGISDNTVAESSRLLGQLWPVLIMLLLGFPLFIFGLLNNYIPYMLPSVVAQKISSDRGYRAPIMMTAGIFIFPIFYGLQIWAVQQLFQNGWLTLFYAVALPLSGFFVLWYWPRCKNIWQAWRIWRRKPSLLQNLRIDRQAIFEQLTKAKAAYLARP